MTELEHVNRALDALADLTSNDKLQVLALVWFAVAKAARNEALINPGGFQEGRAAHVRMLVGITELVAGDEPDLEEERLFQEGDLEAFVMMIQKLTDRNDLKQHFFIISAIKAANYSASSKS